MEYPHFEKLTFDPMVDDSSWEWDVQTNTIKATPQAFRVFGLEYRPEGYSMYDLLNSIHPEDRPMVEHHIRALTLNTKEETTVEYRVFAFDGDYAYARTYGKALYNEEGQFTHLVGITQHLDNSQA